MVTRTGTNEICVLCYYIVFINRMLCKRLSLEFYGKSCEESRSWMINNVDRTGTTYMTTSRRRKTKIDESS